MPETNELPAWMQSQPPSPAAQTAPNQPASPVPDTEPPVPRQRRQRKAKPADAAPARPKRKTGVKATDKPAKPQAKRGRKPKAERAAPEQIRVDLKEYAAMKVGDDAKLFLKLHRLLSAEPSKLARTKILTELQKVLG